MIRTLALWLCLTAISLTGCASVPVFSRHKYPVADERHPVMEVMCVWEAAEGRGIDNLPARGFGGQILFFANGHKEPAKVRGDVRIYVFDEEGVDGDSSKPIHQFDFPAAVWDAFLRPSNLGATYQIFIPYTRKGMHAAKCTLRVRFTPEDGLPIYSRMATIPLAGVEDNTEESSHHILQTGTQEESNSGNSITTADWSELQAAKPVPQIAIPSPPGIPVHRSSDPSDVLQRLRQAAASATDSSYSPEDAVETIR